MSGLGPQSLRAAAGSPGFLAAVLEHVANDEALLIAFAAEQGIDPAEIDRARRALAGGDRAHESLIGARLFSRGVFFGEPASTSPENALG